MNKSQMLSGNPELDINSYITYIPITRSAQGRFREA
jgi:hypothetical protein